MGGGLASSVGPVLGGLLSTISWRLVFFINVPMGVAALLLRARTAPWRRHAVLLNSVPDHRAGIASGVFNTSRQIGGAMAVAIFGALLAQSSGFVHGMRVSLLIAAGVALATAAVSLRMQTTAGHRNEFAHSPGVPVRFERKYP